MNWLHTALTGKDNASVDLGRVLFAASVAVVLGLEVFVVVARGTAFDVVSFAGALSPLLVAGGAGIAIKGHTEP